MLKKLNLKFDNFKPKYYNPRKTRQKNVEKEVKNMPIFRINKTKNYTVMSNHHLRDKKLSFKAKGLLSYMLSLPDTWDYSLKGLCSVSKDNETSIKSALKELKEHNYLKVNKLMPNKTKSGRIEYEYVIFEYPYAKKQEGDFLPLEILPTENQGQINTKRKNTKNKEKIKEKKGFQNYQQREYTAEELDKLYANTDK